MKVNFLKFYSTYKKKHIQDFSQMHFPGQRKGKFNDSMWRDKKGDASSEGGETASSLWGSIKNFLRYVSLELCYIC